MVEGVAVKVIQWQAGGFGEVKREGREEEVGTKGEKKSLGEGTSNRL